MSAATATATAVDGADLRARAHDTALDDAARLQLLAAFEAELARAYAGLRVHAGTREGASAVAKWLPGSDTGAAVQAAQQLRGAIDKLVAATGWPASDAPAVSLSMTMFSTPPTALLSDAQIRQFGALFKGECQGLADYLRLDGTNATRYFLAGLFGRSGADIELAYEEFAYGTLCVSVPVFTVHHQASSSVMPIDPQLRQWLRQPLFASEVSALYDTAITDVRVSVFDDTVVHAFSVSPQRALTFGKIDPLRADPHILLFADNARQYDGAQAAFRGVWFDSVRMHEMLHVLYRAPCPGADPARTIAWRGRALGMRDLNEAQAVIATIASYASADSDLLTFVTMRSFRLTRGHYYLLGDDLFFAPLLAMTAQRERMPSWTNGVPADLTYADRLDLFLKLRRQDVLTVAKAALDTVIAQQALLCAAH